MRALYFGCPRGIGNHRQYGHGFYGPGLSYVCTTDGEWMQPWGLKVDGGLAPRRGPNRHSPEYPQGVAMVTHEGDWTALSFWDRSGDERGNSSSTFLFDDTLDFDAALAAAREHFPALFERFPFEVVSVELNHTPR